MLVGAGVQGSGFADAGVTVGLNVEVAAAGIAVGVFVGDDHGEVVAGLKAAIGVEVVTAGAAAGVFAGDDHGEVAAGLKVGTGADEVFELIVVVGLLEFICATGVGLLVGVAVGGKTSSSSIGPKRSSMLISSSSVVAGVAAGVVVGARSILGRVIFGSGSGIVAILSLF